MHGYLIRKMEVRHMKRENITTALAVVLVMCFIWLCYEYREGNKRAAKSLDEIKDAFMKLASNSDTLTDSVTVTLKSITTPKPPVVLPAKNRAGFTGPPLTANI
jgi:hypothetical protein